ncbi:MAG: NAD(P)/FAD-dependent oxidoreductase, partial [Ktedonobacteraceae bacterium]|nr:NAD(P)/FAD-dependent oxidoreductase [Ktedonobacteraceae bacterium]
IAVVERNPEIGGGCNTEEVTLPGFKHNLHSNYHFFEEGPVARDLELERYGLKYIYPEVQHAMVFRDGTAVCIHRDPQKTAASFTRFSKHDAERYLELHDKFAIKTRALANQMLYSRPLPSSELAERIKGPLGEELLSYNRLTLYEAVDQNFEEERIRSIFKVFLHAIALEDLPNMGGFFTRLLGRLIQLGFVVGGSAGLTTALGRIIEEHGGTIICGKHVEGIEVKGGRAVGVRFADGEVLAAKRFVASGVDAPQTLRMVGEENFGAEISQKLKNYHWATHSLVTLHLALNEAPLYSAAEFDADVNRSFDVVLGADNSQDIAEGFEIIKGGELPTKLIGNGCCNTRFENSMMAPPGKHTAFWWPFAPYELRDGGAKAWDERKPEFTARLLKEWRAFAPNLTEQNVLGTYLFTPLDIERKCINMVRGSHHVGAYMPSQVGAGRPIPELSQYHTPVEGLYLCGASSHSGGAITGSPGYNCANTISEELEIPRWWTPLPSPQWEG